jgi:ribulose-5-phosphate 4-epimerase/fuculose-1-phosphate aldolase
MTDNVGNQMEGVIKYHCRWKDLQVISAEMITGLVLIRNLLQTMGLIGVGSDGLGFGNVSQRLKTPLSADSGLAGLSGFIITGTQTSGLLNPGPEAYCFVNEWSIAGNWVECVGKVQASSESLTHAAIYELSPKIQSVIHVHSAPMWHSWANEKTRTKASVEYGTPAMGNEIRRIIRTENLGESGVLCMGGHPDGIISWGTNADEATRQLLVLISL